jgi:phosphatidylserine decarboxylase
MNAYTHQYIVRETGLVRTETLCADSLLAWMYCCAREKAHWLFNALTSGGFSKFLACVHYDMHL